MAKTIVKFGNSTSTTTFTLSEPAYSQTTGAPTWSSAKSEFSRMDVMFNVKTFTGGTSIAFSVQERFSDVGFVETANSGTLSSPNAKTYILANDGQTGQTGAASIQYGYAMLGKGTDKQIVATIAGGPSVVNVDVYLIFTK